jgi:hypothetical protein
VLIGDPPKIKSVRGIFVWQEDINKGINEPLCRREEEGEEDVKLKKKKQKMCLCLRV